LAQINIHGYFIRAKDFHQRIPGATKANVTIRVVRRIVQIQRESTSIRPIIPIATAFESAFLDLIPSAFCKMQS